MLEAAKIGGANAVQPILRITLDIYLQAHPNHDMGPAAAATGVEVALFFTLA